MTPEPQHVPGAVPPQNLDAEDSVLGAMLISPKAIDDVAEILKPHDFYRASNGRIYTAALQLRQAGGPVDAITVHDLLERTPAPAGDQTMLDHVGGRARIFELAATVPATANAAHYARIIRDLARRRRVIRAALLLQEAAHAGADVDELLHQTRRIADEQQGDETRDFAASLDEFLAERDEDVIPFLGDQRNTILPAAGLAIVAGMPGIGKTTLILDLAFHLASGVDWLGITVPRPARILLVENEGPARMFRKKLREKRELWDKPITGAIYVQTWRWGHLNFADTEARRVAARFCDDNQIDLVVGDPLGTLGMKGVGSPEDTREFVQHLVELGLMSRRSFLFLSHFRKEPSKEELDQVTGAWGQHLDALLIMKAARAQDEVRLSFPKLRWSDDPKKPVILGRVRNTKTFELLGEEGDARLLEQEIIDLLTDGIWRTSREIASKKKGGLGARHDEVDAVLKTNDHLFHNAPGPDVGRHPNATCWQLTTTAPTRREHTGAHPQTSLLESAPNGSGAHHANTAPMRPEHTGAHPENGGLSRNEECVPEEGPSLEGAPPRDSRPAETDPAADDDDLAFPVPVDDELEYR